MAKNKVVVTQTGPRPASGLFKGMMANAEIAERATPQRREGHPMPLHRSAPSGQSQVEAYGIDMTNAPVPSRSYTADGCAVLHDEDDVQIIFTQKCIFGGEIESALVIRVNPQAVMNMGYAFREIANPSVDEILSIIKAKPIPLITIHTKPKQVVNMTANVCSSAIAGHETSLEFFHTSAFAVRKSEGQDHIEMEPVVRVELRTTVFSPLMHRILELDSIFQKNL